MKTYISFRYFFIQSWLALVFCFLMTLIGGFFLMGSIAGQQLDLFFLVPLALAVPSYFHTRTRTIFIENNKVVAKGIFKSNVHEISDFKEVTWEWGLRYGRHYRIYFKNGESYKFYPPLDTFFSISDRVEEINERIRSMMDQ